MKNISIALLILTVLILTFSCSNQNSWNPAESQLPNSSFQADSPRTFLGFYSVHLDPQTQSYSIEPNREIAAHMNATGYLLGWPCGNCLKIQNLHFLPGYQVECDIEVSHPVNDPVFTVFDLRVIAIFPWDISFGGFGVSTALVNRDGLTAIWDNPGIPGYINGYKTYNKSENRRPFGPGDVFSEYFLVQLPGGPLSYDIAVDAGWAPNDGVIFPIEMNSPEVIDLTGSITEGLTDIGGSATISAEMYDYQGVSTIASVTAISLDLFNAPVNLSFESGDANNAVYSAVISNQKNAPAGFYNVLVAVYDQENSNYPYEVASYIILSAEVEPGIIDVEITLAENDDTKTPGNSYDYLVYNGPTDSSVIHYFDADGPWDFTDFEFTNTKTTSIINWNDPETVNFRDDFPDADHFIKLSSAYAAESHDYASNKVLQYGLYEGESIGSSVIYLGTLDGYQYPYNINTDYDVSFRATIESLSLTFDYDIKATGMGQCIIPYNGGSVRNALMVRTIIETTASIIKVGNAILYEWYGDDGSLLATVGAVNLLGEPLQWDENTYEITGETGLTALNDYVRQ